MKTRKIIIAISALALALTATPVSASAEKLSGEQVMSLLESGELPCDADLSGEFDQNDAAVLLKFYAFHMLSPGDVYSPNYGISEEVFDNIKSNFDLDGSGIVDSMDAAYLLEYYYFHYTNSVVGDLDGDGFVTASDASAVLEYYADIQTGEEPGYSVKMDMQYLGDVDSDKKTDAADASAILEIYAENMTKE
ncbi:MAG: hypothetical protein IJ071_08230 [Ruminococcus sp.]|nr:hypothetical protein [Ruminococcus sp.]